MNRDRNVVARAEELRTLGPFLTLTEAAEYMRCTRKYVQRLCQRGQIPFAEMGHRYVIKRQDCDEHIEAIKTRAVA